MSLDLIIQRHLQDCYNKIYNAPVEYRKVYPSRDDYLRKDPSEYDTWLMHPNWSGLPCIALIENPIIATGRKYSSGCSKDCVRLLHPRHTTLASDKGGQLNHAVIKTQILKSMKTTTYNKERLGSFEEINTCMSRMLKVLDSFSYSLIYLNFPPLWTDLISIHC